MYINYLTTLKLQVVQEFFHQVYQWSSTKLWAFAWVGNAVDALSPSPLRNLPLGMQRPS